MAAVYVVSLTAYLGWRFTIINTNSLTLSILYYIAECIGFILGLKAIFDTWNYSHREPLPAPAGLAVDVMVPTYKEPLWIIRRTVMAAKNIKYPHNTFILDDGKRHEVKELAEDLGVQYLRRPDNKYAKAGNLNYGLQHSTADFVMVFDADHIALPHALDVMLGFFDDKNVALVQTPQDFYNIDAFQYFNAERTGGLWHDQSAFYSLEQPCADKVNASSCVGTGAVYRRAALDRIGGIPVDTVTEDIHTALKLHKAGYRTIYLNEPVAYGVAASDLEEYYKTRHRWGHGNLHALRLEKIPFCKGLTLPQRLHYLALGLIYLEGWQQLLLFTIPIITLTFGLQPFTITIFNVLIVLAFPFLSYMLLQEIGCGFARYWANEIFAMARWPVFLVSTAGLFGRKLHFISSSKNLQGQVSWRLMTPQLTVMVACLFSVTIAIAMLAHTGFRTGPLIKFFYSAATTFSIPKTVHLHEVMSDGYTVDLVAIAGAWALYSAVRVIFFVRKALLDAKNTHDFFRFRVPVPVVFKDSSYGCITSLSEDWTKLAIYQSVDLPVGNTIECTAFLPSGPLPLKINIESIKKINNTPSVEGSLVWDKVEQRDQLANSLYSVDWHREFLHRNAYFMTPSDVILSCLRLQSPFKTPYAPWQALLLDATGSNKPSNNDFIYYGIVSASRTIKDTASLVTFTELAIGKEYGFLMFSDAGQQIKRAQIIAEEGLHSLVKEGLDGATPYRYTLKLVA